MPYSEFTIEAVKSRFGLAIGESAAPFAAWPPVTPGALVTETLAETLPLAVAISTEKARSELVIAPVLLEARRRAGRPVSLFSGIDFPVDAAQGLTGVCDFLLSLSAEQLTVEAPAVVVVEATSAGSPLVARYAFGTVGRLAPPADCGLAGIDGANVLFQVKVN